MMNSFWFKLLSSRQSATPLPDGYSEAQVLDLLQSIRLDDAPAPELAGYLDREWRRFLITLELCKGMQGAGLEIGSSPYFTSILLREFSDIDLTLSNYEGVDDAHRVHRVTWTAPGAAEPEEHIFTHDLFNIESDSLPYADESFDVVLFCEVLEHLTHDPLAALAKIHRVLRPGGKLILTTPNVTSLGNVLKMIRGQSVMDRYSAYGPYGRHNREYTLDELQVLLESAGFAVTRSFTANVLFRRISHLIFNSFGHLLFKLFAPKRSRRLGQYCFVSATKRPQETMRRPEWLYRSYDDDDWIV